MSEDQEFFTKEIHVSEEGDILIYKSYWENNDYHAEAEDIGNSLVKIIDLPPILQACEVLSNQDYQFELLILTQEYHLISINGNNKQALELDKIKRFYDFNSFKFVIDLQDNLRSFHLDGLNSFFSEIILENVDSLAYGDFDHNISILTKDKRLFISSIGDLDRQCIKEVDVGCPIHAISGDSVVTSDGRIYLINMKSDETSKLIFLVKIDYAIKDIVSYGSIIYILDINGKLHYHEYNVISYNIKNIEYMGQYKRFIVYNSIRCVEDHNNQIRVLPGLKTINFPHRLIDVDEFNQLNNRGRTTKSARV